MNKIGIVTFYHNSTNFGGKFQSYALCEFLNKNGFDAEQIAFTYKRSKTSESIAHTVARKGFSGITGQMLIRVRSLVNRKELTNVKQQKAAAFEKFSANIPHSDAVYTYKTIAEANERYDVFITGSDQVWNSFDHILFLEFAQNGAQKISYATSNAKGYWTEEEKAKIKKCVCDFDAVSVRDNATKQSLEDATGISAELVADPTLLLDKSDWDAVKEDIKIDGDYMLCYFLGDNKSSRRTADAYAKKHNLKIINIPMNGGGIGTADKGFGEARYDVSPEQFISLVENANCIFTDSFHCVIFAHTYKKQYFIFNRSSNGEMSSRITALTELFGTRHRFLNSAEKENIGYVEALDVIDYNTENDSLTAFIDSSKQFLLKNIRRNNKDISLCDKLSCSGCHSCYNVCPTNSISMVADKDGFLYPEIDKDSCIKCGKCEKACPVLSKYPKTDIGKAYACINNNEDIRLDSSSGGVFTLLAQKIINDGGIVFGAAFDENLSVRHIAVDNVSDLKKLRGSKYVQSVIGDAYKQCKAFLDGGKTVLFTGTPCQIGGLVSYLGRDYDNLITQDIICHGVPSDKLWHDYLDSLEKKIANDGNVNFRNKQNGWKNYSLYIPLENGEHIIQNAHDNPFTKAFQNNLSLKKSCYGCHFKHKNRQSDITLADFWGIKFVLPDMNDDKGTSLLIVNSKKGAELFDSVQNNMRIKEVDFNTAVSYNSAMYRSSPRPENREAFLESVNTDGFKTAAKRYLPNKTKAFYIKVMRRIKRFI